MADTLKVVVEEGLAILRLDRQHGNAINDALVDELMAACQEADTDPQVKGLLLTGAGKLFSPGFDLQELSLLDRPAITRFIKRFNACILSLYTFSKPLVAGLQASIVQYGRIPPTPV